MVDKIERLKHLVMCNKTIDNSKQTDETIEDTLKDLINYSIYYLMAKRGNLENDKNNK